MIATNLGSGNHVLQGSLGLRPASGLQSAIRIDYESVWVDTGLDEVAETVLEFLLSWNSGRVDVVRACT